MSEKLIAKNKRAYFDYEISDKVEAGLVLLGTEVKSIRNSNINMRDAYVFFRNGEAFLINMHIPPYLFGSCSNHDPMRNRKLLLHRLEITKMQGKCGQKGLSLLPLRLYFKDGRVKVELGLGKGKKQHDKREDIKKRDTARQTHREIREGSKH